MYSHTFFLHNFIHCILLLFGFISWSGLGVEASTIYNISTANTTNNISVSVVNSKTALPASLTGHPESVIPSTPLSLVQLVDVLPTSSSLSLVQLADVLPPTAPLAQSSNVPSGSSDASNNTSAGAELSAVLGLGNISYTSTFAGVVRTFVDGHLLEGTALVNAATDTRTTTWTTTFSGPGGITETRTYPQALLDECYTVAWNSNWSASGQIPCGSTRVPETTSLPIWMNTTRNSALVDGFIPVDQCYINFDYVDVFYWPVASSNTDCLSIVDQATFDGKMSGVWNTSGLHARSVQLQSLSNLPRYPPVTQQPIHLPDANIQPRGANGSIIAYGPDNLTFVYPSIYGIFSHIAAYRAAPYNIIKGPYFEAITMAFAPGELSTSGTFLNANPFNFADFPCPPSNVSYVPAPGQPYRPRLLLPEKLRSYLPEWKSCGAPSPGGYDPPRALDPIMVTTTSTPAIRPTLPSPSQIPDLLPTRTSVTAVGDPSKPTSVGSGSSNSASQDVPGKVTRVPTVQTVVSPPQSPGLGGIIQSVFYSAFQPPSPTASNPSPVQVNPNAVSGNVGLAPQDVQLPSPTTSNPTPIQAQPNQVSINAGPVPSNGGTAAVADPGKVAPPPSVSDPIEAAASQLVAALQGKTSNLPVTSVTTQNAANPVEVNRNGAIPPPNTVNSIAALESQFAASLQGKTSNQAMVGPTAQSSGISAVIVQGQTISEGGPPINIGGAAVAYSAGSIYVGTRIVAAPTAVVQQGVPVPAVIGSLTFSAVPPDPNAAQAGVIQGYTISVGGPPAYVNGQSVSYTPGMTDFNGVSVSAIPPSQVAAVISGQTLFQGGSPITVGGNVISYTAGSIYVGSSAIPAPTQAPAGVGVAVNGLTFSPTQVYAPQTNAMPIVVGSQTASLMEGSFGLLVGSQTIVPGAAPITISGTGYSLAPSATQLVVGSSTIPLPLYQPPQAIQPSGYLSLAASDLVVGTSTFPISTALGHTFTVAGQAFTFTDPSAVAIAGSTISANGPGLTVVPSLPLSDVPISLGSNALVIGTSTIPLSAAISQVFTVNGKSFTMTNPSALAFGSTTLSAGGAAVTVSSSVLGDTISLGSQNLVLGTSTIPVTAALGKTYTIEGQTFALTNPSALAIGSTTLSAGSAGITLAATSSDVISLDFQDLVLGQSTIPISAALRKTYTLDGQTFTFTDPSGLVVGMTTLRPGQGKTLVALPTLSDGGAGVTSKVTSSQGGSLTGVHASGASVKCRTGNMLGILWMMGLAVLVVGWI